MTDKNDMTDTNDLTDKNDVTDKNDMSNENDQPENDPNNPNDMELLRQLTAVDPVDIDTVPGPDSAQAQHLLATTMQADASPSVTTQAAHSTQAAHTARAAQAARPSRNDQVVTQMQTRRSSLMRSRAMLTGAAAAVLLLVGGLLVFSPDNTPSAVAAVHSAAAAVDADSGRVTTTFSAVGGDGESADEVFSGTLEAAYSGSDVAFSFEADGNPTDSDFYADDFPFDEGRVIGDVLYFSDGEVWRSIDTGGVLGSVVADFIDPRVVLERVQELTEAIEIGQTTIDGQDVTHYQSVVDLGDETLSQSGWLGFEAGSFDGEGEVTVDMYVADNDLLAQLDLSGDVQDVEGTEGTDGTDGTESGTFEVSMRFTDVGSDITIEAPADAVELNPLEGMLDE